MNDDNNRPPAAALSDDEGAVQTGERQPKSPMSKSMHDGVEVWCDCCSCEAEPYWIEAMQESTDDG